MCRNCAPIVVTDPTLAPLVPPTAPVPTGTDADTALSVALDRMIDAEINRDLNPNPNKPIIIRTSIAPDGTRIEEEEFEEEFEEVIEDSHADEIADFENNHGQGPEREEPEPEYLEADGPIET